MVRRFQQAGKLNAAFHDEVVRPVLGGTAYAAGLLGWGSDVLGYDTERSTDHGWGPRLCVFVDDGDVDGVRRELENRLPQEFRGYPVWFALDGRPLTHHVAVSTLGSWLEDRLGVDATQPMSTIDWLLVPQQLFLGVVKGRVYADDGRLEAVRKDLSWYPDQIWRWLLACQWRRLDQEEPFVQRTAEVGDQLGSAMVAARQTREVMRCALLLARHYAPYTKWFGTAFAELDHRDGLDTVLQDAMAATDLAAREYALCTAYEILARRHNAARITDPIDPTVRPFHNRPALVLAADRFSDACYATVRDPELRSLPRIGAIDQFADSTDLLSDSAVTSRMRPFYEKFLGVPEKHELESAG